MSKLTLRAIVSEFYFNVPVLNQLVFKPLSNLLDTSCVKIIDHGKWRIVYENKTIYWSEIK